MLIERWENVMNASARVERVGYGVGDLTTEIGEQLAARWRPRSG